MRFLNFPIFILLFLMQLPDINAANSLWYHKYFNKLDTFHYDRDCSLIDHLQKVRGYILLAYYRLTHKKNNLPRAMALIQNKLKEFKTWLFAMEAETLLTIKKKYNISDALWQEYLTTLQHIKSIYLQGLLYPIKNIKHDQTIQPETFDLIINLLKKSNINPKSITIQMANKQDQTEEHQDTMAEVLTFIDRKINKQQKLSIIPTYIPAHIKIFPHSDDCSLNDKMSFYVHEIEHLLQQHSLTTLILAQYLEHYCNISRDDFHESKEYQTLVQIQEAQAEIFAAIKNSDFSCCLTSMRKKYFYPDHLYQEHFYHLSTITMLWKVHAWLEFFYDNEVIKQTISSRFMSFKQRTKKLISFA